MPGAKPAAPSGVCFWNININVYYFQVDEIEEKLDRLISMYEDDRKRMATLSSPRCPPCTPLPSSPSPPYAFINHPQNPWVCFYSNFDCAFTVV